MVGSAARDGSLPAQAGVKFGMEIEIGGVTIEGSITGTVSADVILDGRANSKIDGGAAGDVISGAAGKDEIRGGSGRDYAHGGDDEDVVSGGSEDDYLTGGKGRDILSGDAGNDKLIGGEDVDTAALSGGRLSYTTNLGAGGGTVSGPEGTDTISEIERVAFADGMLVMAASDPAAQVYRLYGAALGRTPEMDGLKAWMGGIAGGVTLDRMAEDFNGSPEFQQRYGNPDNPGYVKLLYNNVLGRDPEPSGLQHWLGELAGGMSRATMLASFSESNENLVRTAPAVEKGIWVRDENSATIARLYDTTLDRLPELDGLKAWRGGLDGGLTIKQVANGFITSPEFREKYGSLDDVQFVTQLYRNVLNREPEQSGLNAWVDGLRGGLDRTDVVVEISESPEHRSITAAKIDDGILFIA
jgi:hypothetical protein